MEKYMKIIAIIFLVLIVLYLILLIKKQYTEYKQSYKLLITNPVDATKASQIPASKLPKFNNGNEYTYSFWIFITDWEYLYGKPKCVLYKGAKNANSCNPSVWLYPKDNKMMIRFDTLDNGNANISSTEMNPLENPNILRKDEVCDVENIPLQRWVHVGIVMWNRTTDIYIDGKLVRSCILPGVPKFNNGDLYITNFGGFRGNISRLFVLNKAFNPDAMYNTYLKGPFTFNPFAKLFGNVSVGISIKASGKVGGSSMDYDSTKKSGKFKARIKNKNLDVNVNSDGNNSMQAQYNSDDN